MRHYWLVNSNVAHLVMLMMMALSQQETDNQWNGPLIKMNYDACRVPQAI